MRTVKQLYQAAQTLETPLLSNFDAPWWAEYVQNYSAFDKMFCKLFKTFEYFDDDEEATDEAVLTDFVYMIRSWLLMNSKRYAELYRIQSIPDDDAYSITNNYDRHETYSGTNGIQSSAISGQRTDVTIDQTGEQNTAGLNKVTGWDSGSENTRDSNSNTMGSREDTHQFTKGQEQDTSRSAGQDAHTSRIYGNIGVSTVDDMLKKHGDLWQNFNFYMIIFNDICRQFLLIGRM